MSTNFIVKGQLRTGNGTAASRRARKEGFVPVVVYGGGEDDQYLLVEHNKIWHQLEVEAFHSALVKVEVDGDLQRAVLRDVQMHPYKAQILHMDFQRVSRKDKISMSVPIHLRGVDDAPGVKDEKGIMSQVMNTLDIYCLATDLPEYIDLDVSGLAMGESIHLSELQLPKGVELSTTLQESDGNPTVASVLAPKVATVSEETTVEGEDDEAGAEEGGDAE